MKKDIDSIFEQAKHGRALFQDRNVLSSDYVPKHLPFRDDLVSSVAEVLAPALHGSKPSNLLLYGKTGTGKTAVAKYVIERLMTGASSNLFTYYVNTRIAGTEYRTLAEIASALGAEEVPQTGLSIGALVNKIFDVIREKGKSVILVLDEIDYLVNTYGDDFLYQFTRAGNRISPQFLSLVGISNSLNFKDALDARVLSSLGEEELVFSPYTVQELRSILSERARLAFKPNTVPDATINLCAAIAGSEHGDARRAVDLLRVAGEVAERENYSLVNDECIRKASEKAEQDRTEVALRSLPLQDKIIILAVSKFDKGTSTGEVYLVYSGMAKKLGLQVLTQRRVSGILAELDLLGLVEAAVVSRGRRGRTKRIKLLIDNATLDRIMDEDSDVSQLLK